MRHVLLVLGMLAITAAARGQALPAINAAWVTAEDAPRGDRLHAILTLPPGWSPGDAAALLLVPEDPAPDWAVLARALLAEDTMLMELRLHGRPPQPWIAGAVRYLVLQQGAAIVVAIGPGAAPEALADAARRARAVPPGHPLRALAATIALTDAGPGFKAGAPPEPAEGWPLRVPLLCNALARATPAVASHCAAALVQPAPSLAGLP